MRNPGEKSADRIAGRWKGPGGRSAASGPPAGAGGRPAPAASSLFVPGYLGERPSTGDTGRQAAVLATGGWRGAVTGAAAKGPVRGFPPGPGQPPPVYPPGQFSAWNRAARPAADGFAGRRRGADGRSAAGSEPWSGSAGPWPPDPGGSGPGPDGYGPDSYGPDGYGPGGYGPDDARRDGTGYGEPRSGGPDYAVLAVSDPAADVTATQSWAVVDAPQAPRPGAAGPARDASRLPVPPPGPSTDRLSTDRLSTDRLSTDRAPADRPLGRRAHARARRARRRGRVLLACGLALAVMAAAAAYFWLSGHRDAGQGSAAPRQSALIPRPTQTASPSPSPSPSLGRWGHIETRAADPLTLSLAELFPARFSVGGSAYVRTVERQGTNCAKAVIGSALQSAVKRGKCSQVMRASYLSGNAKMMGTIGVLNLISVAAAEKSGQAAGGGDFIGQLPAAKGPTRHLTKGTGLEETEIKGHYLVMAWSEFANLRAPKTRGQRLQLEAFCNRLFQNTANLSLASRMIAGKPRIP